jgi:hypothetical protein
MTESKKVWVEPELIVLVQNNSEEAVLVTCKAGLVAGSYDTDVGQCSITCAQCAALAGS